MAASRRQRRTTDIWPGFVDALATLLMVIIFLLMIFVVAQVFLSQLLSGKDETLDRLRGEIGQLADLLSLERRANEDLRSDMGSLSDELQATLAGNRDLEDQIVLLLGRNETLMAKNADLTAEGEDQADQIDSQAERINRQAERLVIMASRIDQMDAYSKKMRVELDDSGRQLVLVSNELEDAYKVIEADKEKIALRLREIAALHLQLEALQALKEEMEGKLAANVQDLTAEQKRSLEALAQVALMNKQLQALRNQIGILNATLEASEELAADQDLKIQNLGQRLNAALATKVQELSRSRSEFFGRLRELLGEQKNIQIVGDRFVFQSEVLFTRGSDELGPDGQAQMASVANTLKSVIPNIPDNIDWVLRVDGHTDSIPINTPRFPSNWELSTARAISVVRYFMALGIPPERLAATGFGEYRPLDSRDDEIAYRRNRRIELKLTQR